MDNLSIIIAFVATFVITWLVGFERQNMSKSAGISPHVLIAMSVCAVAIMQRLMAEEAIEKGFNPEAQRIIAQVFSGVGFLGAGVIMKSDKNVRGLTTATTIFSSAIIGAIFGSGYFMLGLTLGIFVIGFMFIRDVYRHVNPFKKMPPRDEAQNKRHNDLE